MSIVEVAAEKAAALGSEQVAAVHLKLGALSGVVEDALRFSFDLACEGTVLEGATLRVECVPVTIVCPSCQTTWTLDALGDLSCEQCADAIPDVVAGREIEIVAMEIV